MNDLTVDMDTVFRWMGKYEIQFRLLTEQLAKSQQATIDALNQNNALRQELEDLKAKVTSKE